MFGLTADEIQLITAFIVLLMGIAGILFRFYTAHKNAFLLTLRKKKIIQEKIDELFEKYENKYLNRILVLTSKNGGGIPSPGGQIRISILFESFNKKISFPLISHWQNEVADIEYNGILLKTIEAHLNNKNNNYYECYTMDLDEQGILKTALESQESNYFRTYCIGQDFFKFLGLIPLAPTKLIYISLNFHSVPENIDYMFNQDILNLIKYLNKILL